MAQLIVRNLEEKLKSQLAALARHNGNSMEEEVRQIIKNALSKKADGLGGKIAGYFADNRADFEIEELKNSKLKDPFA